MNTKTAQTWAVAIALGILGTLQYHLAQVGSRFDTFFGDRGDVRGIVYFCEHWHQWLIGNGELMSPGIFYPTKHTLAYSDFLVGYAIPYSAARSLGFGMFSSMEVAVILLTFLSYVACFFLLKSVLRFSLLPSCAAAMFFAFSSPKFLQLNHLQLQYVVFLPLIFACVIFFARKSTELSQREAGGLLAAAAILWLLQAATTFYYAWFLVFWTILFALLSLALRPSRRFIATLVQKYWRAMVAAAAVFLAGFALFLLSYLPGLRGGEWYRYDFVVQMIPSWWSLLSMGDGNYLWGRVSAALMAEPRPSTWNELRVGLGLVPTLVWIMVTMWVVWRMRSQKRNDAAPNLSTATPAFLAAAVLATTLFFLIGFNYWQNHSPWFLIFNYFPGGKAIRAVSRYVIYLTLPMAVVFAYVIERGLARAARQRSQRTRTALTAAIVFVAAFGVFEQFGVFKVGGTGFSKKAETAYLKTMANKLSSDCAAFYIVPGTVTHNTAEYQYDAMLISIISGIPTLNASSSQFPRGWDLYSVGDPNYEANVQKWIESQQIKGKVCRLEVGPQVEAFDLDAPNPLNDAKSFVRQHYLDFLGREPSPDETNPLVARLSNCPSNESLCNRAEVSLDLFRNTGFFDEGAFIYRLYQVAYGRAPRYQEFMTDLVELRSQSKPKFAESFVTRPEFLANYSGLSEAVYVDKLFETARLRLANEARDELSRQKTRGQILFEVTNNAEVSRAFANRAFVTLHYFGYLRRDPDANGFSNWLQFLDASGRFAEITSGFIGSSEYRRRFVSL